MKVLDPGAQAAQDQQPGEANQEAVGEQAPEVVTEGGEELAGAGELVD